MSIKHLQLVRLLVSRQLTLRYKRSVIGIGWTLLNPLLTSFVLWIVFSFAFAGNLDTGQRYAPYLLAGILLNTFFNQGVLLSADSIAQNGAILTKIYVPPQIFAISTALAGLVNFLIGLLPLALVCAFSGQFVRWTAPLVLVVGFFLVLLVAGLGLTLSILFIRFDDSRNIVNVLLLIMMYMTPIFYPVSQLSPRMQSVVALNPITSFLDAFRWAFSGNASSSWGDWIYLISAGSISMWMGIFLFKKFWPRTVAML